MNHLYTAEDGQFHRSHATDRDKRSSKRGSSHGRFSGTSSCAAEMDSASAATICTSKSAAAVRGRVVGPAAAVRAIATIAHLEADHIILKFAHCLLAGKKAAGLSRAGRSRASARAAAAGGRCCSCAAWPRLDRENGIAAPWLPLSYATRRLCGLSPPAIGGTGSRLEARGNPAVCHAGPKG